MISRTEAEHKFDQVTDLVGELSRYVREAARDGKPIHEVERHIWDDLLKIGHSALGQFIDAQGIGDLGETFTMSNGQVVKRLAELHQRTYQSIFGNFDLERAVYGSREGQKIEFVPLDQRLELPESEFS